MINLDEVIKQALDAGVDPSQLARQIQSAQEHRQAKVRRDKAKKEESARALRLESVLGTGKSLSERVSKANRSVAGLRNQFAHAASVEVRKMQEVELLEREFRQAKGQKEQIVCLKKLENLLEDLETLRDRIHKMAADLGEKTGGVYGEYLECVRAQDEPR
jgi:chromosome segregation ATPase